MATKKPKSPPRKDPVMKRLADHISQDEMAGALYCSTDERAVQLLQMMSDPTYSRFTLAKLCERVGLSTIDVLELVRRYKLDIGILSMSTEVVQVMKDTAEDAKSREEPCRKCHGKGMVKDKNTGEMSHCLHCGGQGQVRVPGNYRARKLMFQVLGLIEK